MMDNTRHDDFVDAGCIIIYRPTGDAEARLIETTGRFPPRLPGQPFFYPVMSFAYAEKIARDWNSVDHRKGGDGRRGHVFLTLLSMQALDRWPIQYAGGKEHQEMWVPAAELNEFNDMIIGRIIRLTSYEDGVQLATLPDIPDPAQ